MRRVMERLNNRMSGFMTQNHDLALVVQCADNEAAIALRAIQGVDDTSPSDMLFVFPQTFIEPASYVEAIYQSFASEHAMAAKGIAEEKLPIRWPELPARLKDRTLAPVQRLREIMTFARSLVPAAGGGKLAWCMFPLTIMALPAWASFIAELVKHEWPYPWCHGMRMYIRDLVQPPSVTVATLEAPRVDHCLVELGPDIIEKGLKEDAADPDLPIATRLNCVLILGGMDQSHRRYDDALKKYDSVLRCAIKTDNQILATAALNGIGETLEKKGDNVGAERYYGAAIENSTTGPAPTNPAVFIATLNAANLAFKQEQWAEAEQYYIAAEQMSNVQSSPRTRVECMENRGVCLYMQQKVHEALTLWDFADACAVGGEFYGNAERIVQKRLDHFRHVKDDQNIYRSETRIAELRKLAAANEPQPATSGGAA